MRRPLHELCEELVSRGKANGLNVSKAADELGIRRQYFSQIYDPEKVSQMSLDRIMQVLGRPEIGMTEEEAIQVRIAFLDLKADGRSAPFQTLIEDMIWELERGPKTGGPLIDAVRQWVEVRGRVKDRQAAEE